MGEKHLSDNKLNLTINNELTEIPTVIDHFTNFFSSKNISTSTIRRISIVIDEMLNNIINYGYLDQKKHQIDFHMELDKNSIVIKITDDGQPFNPFQLQPPKIDGSLDDRDIGGLGVYLTQQIMNEVRYARSGNKNIITLIKNN